jgi:tetratricopeptide (TPR) repeat protein
MAIKNYGKDVPPTQAAMRRLAMCLSAQGKNEEAAQLLHEVTQWSTLLYGADHPLTLYSKDTLGRLLMAMDKANEAEPLFREILAAAPKHASERRAMLISQSSVSLVRLLDKQNRKPEIAPVCREAVAGILNAIAEDEFSTDSQNHVMELVQLLEQQALLKEMEQLTRGYLKLVEQRLPKNDPRMPDAKTCLAFALHNQGKLTDAANLLRAAVVEARAIHGDDHFAVLNPLRELALVLAKKKEFMEAEVLGRAALAMAQRLFGPTDRNTAQTMKILADVLALAGKSTEAEQLRKQAAETAPKRP